MMKVIDSKIGKIVIRRSSRYSSIKIKITPLGMFEATLPNYAPLFVLKKLVANNQQKLLHMKDKSRHGISYDNGSIIGKSHKLIVARSDKNESYVKKKKSIIYLYLSHEDHLTDPIIQSILSPYIIKALKSEAKTILPFRLQYYSLKHGFSYTKVRYSHAGGRWGSCSSKGVISLNIALMKLPHELIDYIICHELAHTKELNHSQQFWQIVETICPNYKVLKNKLKSYSPII